MSDDPNATRDVLRGASDGLLLAIREVEQRESRKRDVRPGDPAFGRLAKEVRIAAEAVLSLAREEEERATQTSGRELSAGLPTINASAPRAELAGILEEWRAVDRRLAAAPPESAEARELMIAFETMRDRYAQAMRRLKDQG